MPATPTKSPSRKMHLTSSPIAARKSRNASRSPLKALPKSLTAAEMAMMSSPIGDASWADVMDDACSPQVSSTSRSNSKGRKKNNPSKTLDTRPKFEQRAAVDEKPRELRARNRSRGETKSSKDVKPAKETKPVKHLLKVEVDVVAKKKSMVSPNNAPLGEDDETPTKEMMDRRRSPRKRSYKGSDAMPAVKEEPIAKPSWANVAAGRQSSGRSSKPTTREPSPTSSVASSTSGTPKTKKPRSIAPHDQPGWSPAYPEPKHGWVTDEKILASRDKALAKGYDTDVYRRYSAEVARKDRIKDVHPMTPNKWISVSRRSWDSQTRLWRRALHMWAGESASCVSSLNSSFRSDVSDVSDMSDHGGADENASMLRRSRRDGKVRNLENPNDLASLLGHQDIDSRRAFADHDESTLKAMSTSSPVKGPTDFSKGLAL